MNLQRTWRQMQISFQSPNWHASNFQSSARHSVKWHPEKVGKLARARLVFGVILLAMEENDIEIKSKPSTTHYNGSKRHLKLKPNYHSLIVTGTNDVEIKTHHHQLIVIEANDVEMNAICEKEQQGRALQTRPTFPGRERQDKQMRERRGSPVQ